MKQIFCSGLVLASMLVAINLCGHCGKCAEDTCEYCAHKMAKEPCDKKMVCTCSKECTCHKVKCPCIKKRCCNKHGKVEKNKKHVRHTHTQE